MKMNILKEIALCTQERIAEEKKRIPLEKLIYEAEQKAGKKDFPFEKALRGDNKNVSFICEIKKASPSKGVITEDFAYLKIAKEYEEAGANAISVLTEPFYFKGADSYLKKISEAVNIPLLRKDFTVNDYMIHQAKVLGANAVLLICSILSEKQLSEYIEIAYSLGLSALVETHNENEIQTALKAGARIIGVNNRDLKTFEVDISLSERLRPLVPEDKIFVSESGIRTREDICRLEEANVQAVLVGETFMKSDNKRNELLKLRGRV